MIIRTVGVKPKCYRPTTAIMIRALAAAMLMVIASRGLSETFPDAVIEGSSSRSLSLEQAVDIAQKNDPWLSGSRFREQSRIAKSVSAGQLPDPIMALGFANLPVDSIEFDQEPMTQFKVGVSQAFPRGDTRALQQQQFDEMSQQQPLLREDRKAKVRVTVSQLWLDVYRNRETIRLIEKDRTLFEHLVDVAEASYSSALGKSRQQDLVRAQLELTRLEDLLTVLQQQQEMARASLGEWLVNTPAFSLSLSLAMPTITPVNTWILNTIPTDQTQLAEALQQHPMIRNVEQQIIVSATGVDLAKQKYKPQWGLNGSYSYRDDDPMGKDRSDFFSLGLSFDVPLFTGNRQDKDVQAAVYTEEALKTDKALVLRSLQARFEMVKLRLQRLNERNALYENRLLQQVHDQAEASLTAYTRDDGDFSEVVRARIAELNANIDLLNINVDRLKALAELNYLLTQPANEAVSNLEQVSAYE